MNGNHTTSALVKAWKTSCNHFSKGVIYYEKPENKEKKFGFDMPIHLRNVKNSLKQHEYGNAHAELEY